ncbi:MULTISPECIES: hypothetical protein [Actinomadura]|uniref:hypothetical protein n=1 Tax=Actinomadura TaxID=1988 RepID=UPI0003FB318B|nr:hypothetical protein [Actinomadura madurae]
MRCSTPHAVPPRRRQGGCDGSYLDADHRNTNDQPGSMTAYRRLDPADYHLEH